MSSISVTIQGGIGNIMFQVANGLALSLRNKYDFFVDLSLYHGNHHQIDKYKTNILQNVNFGISDDEFLLIEEKEFHFNEISRLEGKSKLYGYFQSEKYFIDKKKEVIDFFCPTEEIKHKINFFLYEFRNKNTCSVHVRRGDYLKLENYHPTLNVDYYKTAYKNFNTDTFFLIFSDDIQWCKENLGFFKNKIFVEGFEDFEEIYLMSECDSHIIANSTFSWWGAWLNQTPYIVISPKNWFGTSLSHHNTKDIYLDKWIKI